MQRHNDVELAVSLALLSCFSLIYGGQLLVQWDWRGPTYSGQEWLDQALFALQLCLSYAPYAAALICALVLALWMSMAVLWTQAPRSRIVKID